MKAGRAGPRRPVRLPRLGIWPHLLLAGTVGVLLAMAVAGFALYRALRPAVDLRAARADQYLVEEAAQALDDAYLYGGQVGLQQQAQQFVAAEGGDARIVLRDPTGQVIVDTAPTRRAGCRGLSYRLAGLNGPPGTPPVSGSLCLPATVTPLAAELQRELDTVLLRELLPPTVAGFVGAILLSLLLSERIAAPMTRLAAAARRLGSGDLALRVKPAGPVEVADLASEFNRMAEGLQKGQQQRQALVADVAHELRTPLTVLRGYLEALKDGVTAPDPETLEVIHGQALQLGRLVDDLQDLAQADASALTLDPRPCDIPELLHAQAAGFALQARARDIHMTVDAASPVPTVVADRDRIAQVVRNLVANALRYTPAGGSVRIAAAAVPGGVRVDVADTGVGIAPEHLPQLFERFYRVDPSRARQTGGSGLGLTIAKRLVEAHGGQIGVTSTPGAGSTFWFTLPGPAA